MSKMACDNGEFNKQKKPKNVESFLGFFLFSCVKKLNNFGTDSFLQKHVLKSVVLFHQKPSLCAP
ncbi:MAG: hypothetical protein ACJA1B_000068 [Polaribacter sp.]|jgi:hypothetical protein